MKQFWLKSTAKKEDKEVLLEPLRIESTQKSPEIILDERGEVMFRGRIILEDCSKFFKPLFEWVNDYNGHKIDIILRLDYLNTTATEWLCKFLREIEQNESIDDIKLRWLIEEDDEDFFESVQIFENFLDRSEVTYTFV